MKNWIAFSVVLIISLAGCAHQEQPATTPATFRVISYNIHHAEGTDGKLDVARIAEIVTRNHADLVAIQEVDVLTKRVPIDEPAELARLTHMHVQFGKAIDLQGGQYGQVILSRFPISNPHIYKLPSRPDKEQRIAIAVTVSPGDGHPDFRFVTTHLDHQDNGDRVKQATELMRVLAMDTAKPTILAGDFNSYPESEPMAKVFEHFDATDGKPWVPTVPSDKPRHKIDYILFSKGSPWISSDSKVLDESTASDHRPVRVDLAWR
jgi:endonuclease/exonuclease/phosphatase family metal-dependent hydrolase